MNSSGSMDKIRKKVRELQRLCTVQIFLETYSKWIMPLMFGSGTLSLAAKLLGTDETPLFYMSLACLAIPLVPAIYKCSKIRITERDIAAVIDKEADGGGLLMSSVEDELLGKSSWSGAIDKINLPGFKADRTAMLVRIVVAGMFAAICLWMPMPDAKTLIPDRRLNVEPITKELKDKLEALAESRTVDKQTAELIRNSINELEKNKDAFDPGKVFETIDSLDSALKNLADSSAKKMMETAKAIDTMEAVTEKLAASPDPKLESALRKMAENLADMLGKDGSPADKNEMSLQDAIESLLDNPSALTAESLKNFAEALNISEKELQNAMKKLAKSGADSAQMDALSKFLKENIESRATSGEGSEMWLSKEDIEKMYGKCGNCGKDGCYGSGSCSGSGKGFGPGRGGISRGRGDAPMIFSPEYEEVAKGPMREKLKTESNSMMFSKDKYGISFTAPKASDASDASGGGLMSEKGSGGQTAKIQIAPRDKSMVKKFFSE